MVELKKDESTLLRMKFLDRDRTETLEDALSKRKKISGTWGTKKRKESYLTR